MSIEIQGDSGTIVEVDGALFQALRCTNRPVQSLGSYSYAGFTGILPAALGAGSEVFQFRWTDATRLAVVHRVTISACVSTTFFAAGVPVQIDMVKSSGWSIAGTLGTAISPAALIKKRTSMQSSLVASGDMRIATTAALGAGTKTLETYAMGSTMGPGPITSSLNGQIIAPGTRLFSPETADGEYPIVLATNEGLSVRSVAVPATGTWSMSIHIDWSEVTAY